MIKTFWCPLMFCISFKLETNIDILITKSKNAILNSGMNLVIANELHTRHEQVIIVAEHNEMIIKKPTELLTNTNNCSPLLRHFICELENELIEHLVKFHQQYIDKQIEKH
jgi:hypothetical protein